MFDDWDLLPRIDEDVRAAAARHGIELPEWPEKPLQPKEDDYTDPQEYNQAQEAYTAAMTAYRRELRDIAIARKEAIEQISNLERPTPASWTELAERLWMDWWLDNFIRAQVPCRAARDEATREAIVQCVKVRLYYVILSNAGKWFDVGNHAANWRGFVIWQVPKLARKCANECNPPDGEQPRGDGGGGDEPDAGGPLAYLEQSRELRPDVLVELMELMELIENELSEQERLVIQRTFWDGVTKQQLAEELGISPHSVGRLQTRILGKLNRMFGLTPHVHRRRS